MALLQFTESPIKSKFEDLIIQSQEVYAYLAGFFDGEGHIAIYKQGKSQLPYVKVGATNTVLKPILLFQQSFGGRIGTRNRSLGDKNYKDVYDWVVNDKDLIRNVLQKLLPFLIIKLEKAEQALIIIDNRSDRSLIESTYKLSGSRAYVEDNERYEMICVICKTKFRRNKIRWKTCSRKCGYIFREQNNIGGPIKIVK